MAKKPYLLPRIYPDVMTDSRNDFRGGLNTTLSVDSLNPTEFALGINMRVTQFGALEKRTGSQRMHPTALSGSVLGCIQWAAPGGTELVAIAGGLFYHKTSALGDFTSIDPGVGHRFSTTTPPSFATFRLGTSSAPLVLYIASAGRVYSWDGVTLTDLTGTSSIPDATILRAYHTRLFANSIVLPKSIYWSGVGNVNYTPSTAIDGGAALVDTLSGDSVVAMDTIGSSLIVATRDAIVRYTGYSANDIQIAQDTEGVSAEVGAVGPQAMVRAEQAIYILSDKGPYMVVEAGVQPIGMWVDEVFNPTVDGDTTIGAHAIQMTARNNTIVGHHGGRREVWYAYQAQLDTGIQHVLVYSLRHQRWFGPLWYQLFSITSLAEFVDQWGRLVIIAGCSDGFVRNLDPDPQFDTLNCMVDDRLSAGGSTGSAYRCEVILAPYFFQDGPGYAKRITQVFAQMFLDTGNRCQLFVYPEGTNAGGVSAPMNPGDTAGQALGYTKGTSVQTYRFLPNILGHRIMLDIQDVVPTSPNRWTLAGIVVEAIYLGRP